jgi:hypothetical protein
VRYTIGEWWYRGLTEKNGYRLLFSSVIPTLASALGLGHMVQGLLGRFLRNHSPAAQAEAVLTAVPTHELHITAEANDETCISGGFDGPSSSVSKASTHDDPQ